MLTAPRVIAIDDEAAHIKGLTRSLNQHGVACLPIHFTGNPEGIRACPDVRIVFADLHLVGADANHRAHFSTIGGLLEDTIKPAGPYIILLWTRYPNQAVALREFLEDRLEGVTTPFDVRPLDKSDHLDAQGDVSDPDALMQAIVDITGSLPQLGALFDWESRVLGATGNTVSSILELIATQEMNGRSEALGRILTTLAIAAAGTAHVDEDRFRAVNEALLPILEDRIASLRTDDNGSDVWQAAVNVEAAQALTARAAGKLNWMAQFAQLDSTNGHERGAVITLVESIRERFSDEFGVEELAAARDQFRCKDFDPEDNRFRWVLVQVQAACDYAQRRPGSLPCYLGLDLPSHLQRSAKAPESLWRGPVFEIDGSIRVLHVNAQFPVSVTRSEFENAAPMYRLREQILNDLTYRLHSHGGRPGMLRFTA